METVQQALVHLEHTGMPSQAQMAYAQRTTSLHSRTANHPQQAPGDVASYKAGQRPTPVPPPPANYVSYTTPAHPAMRFVQQQSPYGTAVPYRDNPYNLRPRVPVQTVVNERQQPMEYVSQVRPRISMIASMPPSAPEYLPAMPRNRLQQAEPYRERERERTIDLVTVTHPTRGEPYRERERDRVVVQQPPPPPPPDLGPTVKKIRLAESKQEALRIDTRQESLQPSTGYNPQVEAISPTLPLESVVEDANVRSAKDELLQQISKVDREISKVESAILKHKKKEQELEEAACLPDTSKEEEEERLAQQPKHQSLAQKIYAENRRNAQKAHGLMEKLGPKIHLPLYNQPSDNPVYHDNRTNHGQFKKKIVEHLHNKSKEREARERYITQTYSRLVQEWHKKVEKVENSSKRKTKDAKNREFFEKVFPELRKQREDRERFNRVGARIKSEADLEEIMDGLQEQEMEEKKMRSYAVIPPLLLDETQRQFNYINNNSKIEHLETEYKERQVLNVWTAAEVEVFKEKFLQHPKNFGMIASYLDRKTSCDCVQYYYLSKKQENYKRLLRKSRQRTRGGRNPHGKVNSSCGASTSAAVASDSIDSILSSATGVTTRLQREQLQKQEHPSVPQPPPAPSETPSNPPSAICDKSVESSVNKDNIPSPPQQQPPPVQLPPPPPPPLAVSLEPLQGESATASTATGSTSDNKVDNKKKEKRKEDKKKKQEELGETTEEDIAEPVEVKKGLQMCIVCKNEAECTRALTRKYASQYGLNEEDVPVGSRVCNSCRCKTLRSKYTQCPLPTCPNNKGHPVKRLRPLPMKWAELPRHIRDPVAEEFQITPNISKCCSTCFNRIVRKLTPLDDGTYNSYLGSQSLRWTEEEIESLKHGIKEHGNQWSDVAKVIGETKTQHQCKNFFFNYKKKFGLDLILQEYNKAHLGEERKPSLTDEEESGSSTSSCDEMNNSGALPDSDTASAGSPQPTAVGVEVKEKNLREDPKETEKEILVPPALVVHKEDYDSSATMQPAPNRDREIEGTLDLSIKKTRTEYRETTLMKNSPLAPPHSVTVYRTTTTTHTESAYYHQIPSKAPGLLGPGVGSILHGTPVTSPSLYSAPSQPQAPPPSRYEMRQMTPPHTKEASAGSITQGTPVHQRNVYPVSGGGEWVPKRGTVSTQSLYPPRSSPAYSVDQKQLILNDYITSQQMHGTVSRRPIEKPGPLYYQPRQGVIQRHNTKPVSPHQYLPGHEALSSLVDVAVRLPSLPVPDHKDPDKRHIHEGLAERFNRDSNQERFTNRDQERIARENHQILQRSLQDSHHQQQQIQQQQQIHQQQRERHQQQQIRDQQIRDQQIRDQQIRDQQIRDQLHQPMHHHRELERQQREHQIQQQLQIQQHQRDLFHHKQQQQLRENHLQHLQQQQQRERDLEHHRIGRLSYNPHREDLPPSRLMPFREQNPPPTVRPIPEAGSREANRSPVVSAGSRQPGGQRDDPSTLTAASLIDAIITHQINQTSSDGQTNQSVATNANSTQQVTRPGDRLFQVFHRENSEANGKLSPLKTSGISLSASPDLKQGSITLGEHIDAIINKDYPPTSRHPQFQSYESQAWKLRHALQQKEQLEQSQQFCEKNDERNIVRMVGPPSPAGRAIRYYDPPSVPLSPLDYVKNRIVEVMRTSEEEGGPKSGGGDSPGGGDMVIDEGDDQPQTLPAPFMATSATYTYPFSALSLNATAPSVAVPVPLPNVPPKQPVPAADPIPEPAPLLSAQYEPLSDED